MNQPDKKKRILGQTKTKGYRSMYQKSSQKYLGANAFPIFLKNSRYFMNFSKNYAIFSCFFEFLVVSCGRKVLYDSRIKGGI